MKTVIDLQNLKHLLELLRNELHDQAHIELLNFIIEEIEKSSGDLSIPQIIQNNLTYRATDVVYRILIELLKHAAAGEVLHVLYEALKKLGD